MKAFLLLLLFATVFLTGCSSSKKGNSYVQITQEEAKDMMNESDENIILDVREDFEYASAHIPNAQLLPLGEIDAESAEAVIPSKESTVLVYCRSGNRSKAAAELLVELGYTNVYEFGGIITWPYEIE